MHENPLEDRPVDRAVAIAKGVVGAVPIVGALAAEALTEFIPGQKLDRLESWLNRFSERVSSLENGVERLRTRLSTPEGADVFEDGAVQASRALSDDRRTRLANLIANGLAGPDFEHDKMKTLVRLFSQLTDSELIHLTFYSQPPTMGSAWHKRLVDRYPDVLRPLSREIGLPQEQRERVALQDHHKDTLARLGLLKIEGGRASITALGQLLVRYLMTPDEQERAS
jgi:hypothetical protein